MLMWLRISACSNVRVDRRWVCWPRVAASSAHPKRTRPATTGWTRIELMARTSSCQRTEPPPPIQDRGLGLLPEPTRLWRIPIHPNRDLVAVLPLHLARHPPRPALHDGDARFAEQRCKPPRPADVLRRLGAKPEPLDGEQVRGVE